MSISVQVLDIFEYNELPTVANGYTLVSKSYGGTTSVLLSTPYTLGIQTFTTINIQTHGFIQFLNTAYPNISTTYSESISGFLSKYGIAVAWDDLQAQADDAIGYKYANNNTQIIVNYSTSVWLYATLKVQAKVTINLDNHPTSPGSIRIAYGLLKNSGGGVLGVSYGPASTSTTVNTMNYVVSATPTNFVYPNIPVQVFTGTNSNYLTNKTIVYNIQAPNRAPVLSNNITISEIYGETTYSVNLNNYTTDSDSSLSDVVYTLNPNGAVAMPNNTTLRFWMRDVYSGIYGDTWNGGYAVIRNSSNSVVATLTGPSVNNNIWIYQDIVLSGVNTITWTVGSYANEPQLFISSPSYPWATSNGDPPALGGGVYYRTIGISNRTDTLNFKTVTPLLGVSLSGSILTLNSTLYNCDEFYFTAKNTGITYTSNQATCSFTRLTAEQIAAAIAASGLTYNGSGELTSAIVNSLLNNKPIVIIIGYSSIGESAFQNVNTVTSITIPTSVASIGASAFQGMTGLTSITIPSSVTSIGSNAFLNSGIKSVIIQSGMLVIPTSAFQNATTVTSITIPSTVTSIGASAFQGMTGLTSITIPSSVTSIGSNAFLNSGIKSVIIQSGMLVIPTSAFQNATTVTSITIPTSVTSIGASAFQDATGLTSITIPTSVTSIGASAFQGMTGITSITIPSSVNNIGASAFQGMTGLTSITIPSSVTSIGDSAFQESGITIATFEVSTLLDGLSITTGPNKTLYGKSSMSIYLTYKVFNGTGELTSTIVNDNGLSYARNLTITGFSSIGASAFQDATGLTSITIPSSVTSIGASAFQGMTGLTSITIPSSVTSIGASAFQGMTGLTSITIPSSVTSIGDSAFQSSGITTATFAVSTLLDGLSMTFGPNKTLYGKSGINVYLASNVFFNGTGELTSTIVNDNGLSYARNLTITGFSSIGASAFQGMTGLTSITIPTSVTSIGASAFQSMTGITSITIPSSVNNIGASAFQGMTGITSITIPSSVTFIGANAFQSSGITTAIFEESTLLQGLSIIPGTGKTLYGKSGITVSWITRVYSGSGGLDGSMTNNGGYLYGATKVKIVGYSSIGSSTFWYITTLTSVTIPSSMTSIGGAAFGGCPLTEIIIDPANNNYTSINNFVFNKAQTSLVLYPTGSTATTYTIPAAVTSIEYAALYIASNLKSINLNNITSIGGDAFLQSGLTSITIPASVTNIGSRAFYQIATIQTYTVDANNNYYSSDSYGALFNKSKTIFMLYPGANTSTTSYTIPSTVTSLSSDGNNFYGASTLRSITFPSGVTRLEFMTINNCSNLTNVTLPASLAYISNYIYYYSSNVTSITIPASVTFIDTYAFGQSGITSAIFAESTLLDGLSIIPGTGKTLYGKSGITVSWITKVFNSSGSLTGATALLYGATSARIATYSSIGTSAFQNATGLTSITIPSSVTSIGGSVFEGATGLTSVTIPSSVKSIGGYAFKGTTSLTTITIPSSVTSIGDFAFENATGLRSIVIPSLVTSIGQYTFRGATGLTSVTIPSSVTNIGTSAFQDAIAITSINIPSSVTSIGSNAFLRSGITSAIFEESTDLDVLSITPGSNITLFGKAGVTVSWLTKVFNGGGSLTGATALLYGATNVRIVTYSSIGASAFQDASGVTSITISSSVTSIGASAFHGMTNITTFLVDVNNNNYSSDSYGALFNKDKTIMIQYPIGNTSTSYTIPNTVASIGATAFLNANSLRSITIPSSVISIGASAFQGISRLTSITIPSGVTNIGEGAFLGMTGLTSVTIPSYVTSIGSNAFLGSGIRSVIIQSGMLVIPTSAFQDASGVTSVTIPESVTSIGASAFQGMTGLTSMTIPSAVINIGASAFQGMTGLTTITIPSLVTSIGANAFKGATSLATVTFPLGVGESSVLTSIGAQAFENTDLTTAFFESASTVNTLGLLNGDLINGYTVSSFYGKASITFIYTVAVRAAIAVAPAAVISNNTFTSLLTSLEINISNITSEVIPNTNDPYVEYSAKLTIPEGDLSTLSNFNKLSIINNMKALYAAQLGVAINKVIVTLSSGSIIINVNVLNDGITEANIPICFPKGTPVTTNQGEIAIEKLNPDIHTIRGKKIVAITQSRPLHKYIISIEKDAFGKNVPSAPIQISKEHKVFYNGKMVKANELVEVCEGVTRIPYSGETLYNVLMEKHDKMMINNVICETLDPNNIMAKICGGKYNLAEQDKICKELNNIIKTDNIPAYKKLYASLK